MKIKQIVPAFALVAMMTLSAQVGAVVISTDNNNVVNIPGLTGFATTGAMMDGLSVTASFAGGTTQTLSWADLGGTSGGVNGTVGNDAWSLTVAGNTFSTNAWSMALGGNLTLNSLTLDGTNGLTVFDRSRDFTTSTDGSANGKDINTGTTALYSNPIGVNGAAPLFDLYQIVSVDFLTMGSGTSSMGVSGDFQFSQDTDNDSRFAQVPEPSVIALFGLGLVGLGFARRRRQS